MIRRLFIDVEYQERLRRWCNDPEDNEDVLYPLPAPQASLNFPAIESVDDNAYGKGQSLCFWQSRKEEQFWKGLLDVSDDVDLVIMLDENSPLEFRNAYNSDATPFRSTDRVSLKQLENAPSCLTCVRPTETSLYTLNKGARSVPYSFLLESRKKEKQEVYHFVLSSTKFTEVKFGDRLPPLY